jgi:hypothetical protein
MFDYSNESNARTNRDGSKLALDTAPEQRERMIFTMSTSDITATDQPSRERKSGRSMTTGLAIIEGPGRSLRFPFLSTGLASLSGQDHFRRLTVAGIVGRTFCSEALCAWQLLDIPAKYLPESRQKRRFAGGQVFRHGDAAIDF